MPVTSATQRGLTQALGGNGEFMTSRDLYAIGARLLALYFVVAGFASLPSIYAAYEVAANSDTLSPPLYTLAAASQSFTLILVGFVLLWMHKIPKGATFGSLRSETVLRVGLKLLGIFFAVSGLIGAISTLGEALVVSSSMSLRLIEIIPSLLYLAAGLVLALRTAAVVRAVGVAA